MPKRTVTFNPNVDIININDVNDHRKLCIIYRPRFLTKSLVTYGMKYNIYTKDDYIRVLFTGKAKLINGNVINIDFADVYNIKKCIWVMIKLGEE